MSSLTGRLVLNEDVLLIPVLDLPDESRSQIECRDDDVAISRLGGRSGSKIVDADTAALLNHFREPRSAVEAVILFARARSLEPDSVLESAFPMLRSMTEGGILVAADENGEGARRDATWTTGTRVMGGVVLRTLQVLEDTEVHLVAGLSMPTSVLKVERTRPTTGGFVRERLIREAGLLTHLGGDVAPRLYRHGEIDGRHYLELEFVAGIDVATAAAEWRERSGSDARGSLLALFQTISTAYTRLHGRGVLHGDVHPRNVLVDSDGGVRLLDFGLARSTSTQHPLATEVERGGIPFFFEPEYARAQLSGSAHPLVTSAGEQYSVAALLYLLATGSHWQDFRLDRDGMLRDIVERPVLSFSDRGATPWPSLEAVLARALAKQEDERFPSMEAFSTALAAVSPPSTPVASGVTVSARSSALSTVLDRALNQTTIDGPWMQSAFTPAPTTSLTYGSAGVALGLLCVALRRGDQHLLALADAWTERARREITDEGAFYNAEIEITQELCGSASPYHCPSGVYATAALVARATGDRLAQGEATAEFLSAAARPAAGLDATLGTASTLLGATLLLDAAADRDGDWSSLRRFGDDVVSGMWQALDAKPAILEADVQYPGAAHGWAGFLYATLQWCRVAGVPPPDGIVRRLSELGDMAIPTGRGVEWPWVLNAPGQTPTMPGWCNGSAGYVYLWTLAHRLMGQERHLDLAARAAWNAWESADPTGTLCCGLVGRAYALLNFYRHTGQPRWLDRARDLAVRAARDSKMPPEYPHSLYKGEFGLAVLAADLEQPDQAVMPFFEAMGYGS